MINNQTLHLKQQRINSASAVVAGISLIIMFFISIFAFGYAHSALIVNDNPALTLTNIQAANTLFQAEIAGWIIIIVLDLLVTWAFYAYLRPTGGNYAIMSALLRLAYTLQLAFAVSKLISAASLISAGSGNATLMLGKILSFESIWSLGLIIFGLHLVITGLAALRSEAIPRAISILLVIAGLSYTLIHTMDSFLPQLDHIKATIEMLLMLPMVIGELGFGIWLLVKGRNVQQ